MGRTVYDCKSADVKSGDDRESHNPNSHYVTYCVNCRDTSLTAENRLFMFWPFCWAKRCRKKAGRRIQKGGKTGKCKRMLSTEPYADADGVKENYIDLFIEKQFVRKAQP